jgi:5'-methylthioadenosine phosphorylase
MVVVGLIGGTGVYDLGLFEHVEEKKIHTPYGDTSDVVTVGSFKGRTVVIIPRHGGKHTIPPGQVNYRANIFAMKELGVTHVFAPTAVGSLKEEYKPGDLVFFDQYINRTSGRDVTFYEGNQVCHVSNAEPFCPSLRGLLHEYVHQLGFSHHKHGTCIVMEGPAFSTKAESKLYQQWGADIINMTTFPECVLAREMELCYVPIAMVTDYDCWRDSIVNVDAILATMKQNTQKVKELLTSVIPTIPEKRTCLCKDALKGALM